MKIKLAFLFLAIVPIIVSIYSANNSISNKKKYAPKMLSEYTLAEIAKLPQNKRDNLMNYLYYKSNVDGELFFEVLQETSLEYGIKSGATIPKIQAP